LPGKITRLFNKKDGLFAHPGQSVPFPPGSKPLRVWPVCADCLLYCLLFKVDGSL
jgi:hypothetical protein